MPGSLKTHSFAVLDTNSRGLDYIFGVEGRSECLGKFKNRRYGIPIVLPSACMPLLIRIDIDRPQVRRKNFLVFVHNVFQRIPYYVQMRIFCSVAENAVVMTSLILPPSEHKIKTSLIQQKFQAVQDSQSILIAFVLPDHNRKYFPFSIFIDSKNGISRQFADHPVIQNEKMNGVYKDDQIYCRQRTVLPFLDSGNQFIVMSDTIPSLVSKS